MQQDLGQGQGRGLQSQDPVEQESRGVSGKAIRQGLKFADNIHYKFKSSQASKARFQSSKCTGAKQNLTQNSHSS